MTLRGFDAAGYYQPLTTIQDQINKGAAFGIIKASQGSHASIALHDSQVALLRKANRLVGHYEYCDPRNSGRSDALWFLQNAKAQAGDVLAADFEPYGINVPVSSYAPYLAEFAQTIHAAKGVWPWVYMSDYHLGLVTANANAAALSVIRSMPLWKAGNHNSYAFTTPGNIYGWSVLTAWQYTDTPLDMDYFYGDAATWHKLAIPGAAPVSVPAPKPAPTVAPRPPYRAVYTVRSGDTLTSIAIRFYGIANTWKIAHLNNLSNPDLIYPGQQLRIPW